jgi:glucose/arabinose dehydrogenase
MRLPVAAAVALALALPGVATASAPSEAERAAALRLVQVAGGLASPTHAAAAPGQPARLYVVEKRGTIRVVVRGKVQRKPFLDIRKRVRSTGYEQGLLSVAFHPRYGKNRHFYVDYTNRAGDTEVVEYRYEPKRKRAIRKRVLIRVDQPYANHNGGQLAFGPDRKLYVGMGDGGSSGDPQERAQNLSTLLGKILRLDVSKARPTPELVALGVRNPWRFSFDRATGDLWVADVGNFEFEEVDLIPAGTGLVNLGWDAFEAFEERPAEALNPAGELVFPVHAYSHDDGNCSITGGFVHRGKGPPQTAGRYFFGDFCSGTVWSLLRSEDGTVSVRTEPVRVPLLSSFGEGLRGELYLVSLGGTVYRLAG